MFRLFNQLFRKIGFQVNKYDKNKTNLNDLRKKLVYRSPVIFDVGANIGQSIDKYLKQFKKPKIHVFEPNKEAFEILEKKFDYLNYIYLNNFALGEKNSKKKLNYTHKSGSSSFHQINLNTDWIKKRSKSANVKPNQYIKKKVITEIKTLDDYVKNHKIKKIDLLKIDTQGYEEKVLLGSIKSLSFIKNVELEIMLDECYKAETSFYHIENILYPKNFKIYGMINNKRHKFESVNFGSNVFYSKN